MTIRQKTKTSTRLINSCSLPNSRSYYSNRSDKQSLASKTITTVIVLAIITVFCAIIYSVLNQPELLVKREVENLASLYYEQQIYSNITNPSVLSRYEETGLAIVTLRQLLLHNPPLASAVNAEKYCDENTTLIKYYPYSPYQKNDFRVEYTYSCEFETN